MTSQAEIFQEELSYSSLISQASKYTVESATWPESSILAFICWTLGVATAGSLFKKKKWRKRWHGSAL